MERKVRFINYPEHFRAIKPEILRIVEETLDAGDLILRHQTDDFERRLADFCGTKHAIGVSNCTDALFLSYRAAGIGAGDEVITTPHTFVATVASIVHTGATPVLVDLDDENHLDPDAIEAAITPRTKAIVPVSLNGRVCQLDRIVEIANRHNLVVVEDSAQGLGAMLDGKMAGSWGIAGTFSFYPAKTLGAFGDAGAVITNDDGFAERIRTLRNHGRTSDGDIAEWSYNCRIDNLHAAMLDFKLQRLPAAIERRRELAQVYDERLKTVDGLCLPASPSEEGNRFDTFQNYEIWAPNRAGLADRLRAKGVEFLLPWGGRGVHQFQRLGLTHFNLPRADKFFAGALLLPMYAELKNDEAAYVADVVAEFYAQSSSSSCAA
jgi:aminotransferase EvaB